MDLQYAQITPRALYVHESTDTKFLDESLELILSDNVEQGMMRLGENLHELYASTTSSEWSRLVKYELLQHPICQILMQDPLTARSFKRPRGYAGDAKLLDMVYFPEKLDDKNISTLGKKLFRYTSKTELSLAIIKRIKLVAGLVDEAANRHKCPRVLSVASGHCREAEFSLMLQKNRLERFVALDHDPRSLGIVNQDYASSKIETVCQSVAKLLKENNSIGQFDLIYSAGLYDYLSNRFAQKLTAKLFDLLVPGGKLVLMNIDSDYREIGYMESYMNWAMIGRGALDLLELADGLDSNAHATLNLLDREDTNMHFHMMEIIKN